MQIRMVIFALDGVICRLDRYHYLAWKEIADELGIPFTEQQSKALLGLSRKDSLALLLQNYPARLSEAEQLVLAEQKNEIFQEKIRDLEPGDCAPGIRAAIRKLKKSGYMLAVATANKNATDILRKLQLFASFDYVADGTACKCPNPCPQLYRYVCMQADVTPKECLVVESGARGREAGRSAGMYAAETLKEMERILYGE